MSYHGFTKCTILKSYFHISWVKTIIPKFFDVTLKKHIFDVTLNTIFETQSLLKKTLNKNL